MSYLKFSIRSGSCHLTRGVNVIVCDNVAVVCCAISLPMIDTCVSVIDKCILEPNCNFFSFPKNLIDICSQGNTIP
jgi:hypothetical protein